MMEKLNDMQERTGTKIKRHYQRSISSGYTLEMLKGHDIQKFPFLRLQIDINVFTFHALIWKINTKSSLLFVCVFKDKYMSEHLWREAKQLLLIYYMQNN